MIKKFKIVLVFLISYIFTYAYDINDKVVYQHNFENKTIYLPLNNYRILNFEERIKNIQLTNSENIQAEFIDNENNPLKSLKVLGKNIGNESAIVTFEQGKTIQINFSIMQNLDSIISLVKLTYPNLIIEQANDTILLKGFVKDYKEKEIVVDIFKKAGIEIEEKLVDMIKTSTPSKMIRVKLYAVEINNDEGLDLKNNWTLSSRNYMQVVGEDGLYQNYASSSYGIPTEEREIYATTNTSDPDYDASLVGTVIGKEYVPLVNSLENYRNVNNQRIGELDDALRGVITNAVSLSGGLSGVANYLGKNFNAGLVLQYLSTEGVANLLDETTLLTLENKDATFHAGGTIRIKTQTTTAEGVPTSTVEKVKYGLQLDIKAKNIMNDNYIDLEIKTSSTQIDWANQVDGIPSFLEKEIVTNVLAKDGATIVLGGLINNQNSYDMDKIPLLGDIPVLGFLFRSKAFRDGKSELVFFITPEVVDPAKNNQDKIFKKTRNKMLDTSKFRDKENIFEKYHESFKEKENKKIKETNIKKEETSTSENISKLTETKLTQEEAHQKRVNEILGY